MDPKEKKPREQQRSEKDAQEQDPSTGNNNTLGREYPEEVPDLTPVNPTGDKAGIQTGQTTRGSFSTDPATGAGRYADHNGTVTSRTVAQPGNEQEREPDAVDPKI